ncbi:MAG: hypothetical protein AAGD28_03820 [Bacteroidota bacterium]
MSKNRSREDLRRMIAMGKEAQVIDWLLAHLEGQPRDIRRQITIQSNRFQKLKRKRLEGSIDRNSANVESSQISGILLEILDTYDFEGKAEKKEGENEEKVPDNQVKKSPRLASVGMLLLGIALVSASALLIWNLLGNKSEKGQPKKEEKTYNSTNWLGSWEVDFISEGKDRKASLELQEEGKKWTGKVRMLAEGGDATYDLLLENIQSGDNYRWIEGRWRTEDDFIPAMHGEFRLGMKGEGKAFEGYFRNRDGSGQQNSWKGKKN